MITGRIVRRGSRQWLLGCGVQLAALGWLGVLSLGSGALVPLLSRQARVFLVPGVLFAWMGTFLPALLLVALVVIVRRNRALDRAFVGWGPGRALAPVARAWAAEVDGRALNAWFSKGPQLEIYVTCGARTQGGVGPRSALAGLAAWATGREPIDLGEGLVASGRDAAWMRALTSDPAARVALTDLLADEELLRAVVIQPDAVKLTLRGFALGDLTPERASDWTRDLVTLARTIDALSPTADPVEPGGLQSRLRTSRGSLGGLALFVIVSTLLLVAFSVALAAVAVVLSGV